ncbi:family 43 glycosylhydrolase [Parasegetibacter sp. NRK P23]|uniref:glycoside hydrolase family 43 protein n=1 Tax=Parasegetibacter sp. NRK P23 TaxID=2942999 RepID=UPI0020433431|nr:glycoside hydrolase family 43 protein [Parasegetibacter sp. NRK P23]MCM5528252.1 glycoside hydrolase family 43 protein [Parasegetibacter sp. NRK P23]
MLKNKRTIVVSLAIVAAALSLFCKKKNNGPGTPEPPPQTNTFMNPLLSGADPWVIQRNGFYYYTHTLGNRVGIWKAKNISALGSVPGTTVYTPTAGGPNAANVWAPEIHFLNNKWYIYYTAGSGPDVTQRTWVLENSSTDPLSGTWVDKGKIFAADADFWAIDGSVLEYNGTNYFLWSGRPNQAVQNQNIYIAKMSNPWTLEGPTTMLTQPVLPWEVNGGPVNEGPQIIKNKQGKVFMVYSASGCWTDDYALGIMALKEGGDPLKVEDWTKGQQPVFTKNPEGNAYGPGHNAFFTSPDGQEDWIIYHANSTSGAGCSDKRNVRIQRFQWKADGTPDFGRPVKTGVALEKPSGEQ